MSDRETVRRRFAEAGLADDRFVAVVDGEKKCVDHDTRHDQPPAGNFGVYADADDPLVVLDVDDYADDGDAAVAQGLAGLARLPATLQQASPHGGTHHIYRVETGGEPVAEVFDRAFGTANPVASWGDLQVANKYVVGAGSQLDGCGKTWCDDCADPDGGRYTVGEDTEIATVDADRMVEALRADPKLAPDDEGDESAEDGGESDGGGSPEVTETLAFALDESDDDGLRRLWRGAGDADDRSVAECSLATKLGWWLGHNRSTIGTKRVVADVLDGQHTPDGWAPPNVEKWDQRGEDYRETVLEAVEEVDEGFSPAGGGSPPSSADRPLRERIAAASEAIDGPEDVPEDILDAARSLDPDADEAGDESGEDTAESDEELEAEAETTATADGGSAAASADDSGPRLASTLEPESVRVVAGVDTADGEEIADLTDRAKAAAVWELIGRSNEVHVRVRRDNGSLWAFDGGIWKNEGERALRHAARQALGPINYGGNVLEELKAQARADPTAEIERDTFGLGDGAVAVEDGYLDLRAAAEGEPDALRPLRPSDYALARLPVPYDADAEGERWREFVDTVVETPKIDAVQEYVGYCLHRSGLPINRALLLVGTGSNGKSTFLNTVKKLLGSENVQNTPLHKFADDDRVAGLHGKLANIDADLSEGSLSKEGVAMFKRLTGDDPVEGRHLYEDAFQFEPVAKHLYAANQVPDVSNVVGDEDVAFWRRWLIVKFPTYIREPDRDPDLGDELERELPGVLNWAIEGWARCRDQGGFTGAETYEETRDMWKKWGESADEFLLEVCQSDSDAANLHTSEVYDVYRSWCRQNGRDAVDQRELTMTLKRDDADFGYKQSVRTGRNSVRAGFKRLGFDEAVHDALADVLAENDDSVEDVDSDQTGLDDVGG